MVYASHRSVSPPNKLVPTYSGSPPYVHSGTNHGLGCYNYQLLGTAILTYYYTRIYKQYSLQLESSIGAYATERGKEDK